jgi:hypothetical protein
MLRGTIHLISWRIVLFGQQGLQIFNKITSFLIFAFLRADPISSKFASGEDSIIQKLHEPFLSA